MGFDELSARAAIEMISINVMITMYGVGENHLVNVFSHCGDFSLTRSVTEMGIANHFHPNFFFISFGVEAEV